MRFRNNHTRGTIPATPDVPVLGYETIGENTKYDPELLMRQLAQCPRMIHVIDPVQEEMLASVRAWEQEVKAKAEREALEKGRMLGGVALIM